MVTDPITVVDQQAALKAPVTIAVASDLHCYSKSDPMREEKKWPDPSYLCADGKSAALQRDPLTDLPVLIENSQLKADILLCPGDLGDRASPSGIPFAWKGLQQVASQLGAKELVGTAGNHDINYGEVEPDVFLKQLTPLFPINSNALRNKYWTDHYTILEHSDFRLICSNSSAHHHSLTSPEADHGRITERTIMELRQVLENTERKAIQIFLCHHHPHQHSEYRLGETDMMKGGQLLLDLLQNHGNWLVVHGHKHHPRIIHAAGGCTAPWIFAAGSLAVYPNPTTQGHAFNQFYLIEMAPDTFSTRGWGGRIRAWDWIPQDGWQQPTAKSGLAATSGFGLMTDIRKAVAEIRTHLPVRSAGYLKWDDLLIRLPWLHHMCPLDIRELTANGHGIAIEFGANGVPLQIAEAK